MTKLNKKYFWFKLKEDFFQSKEIKMIRKLPSGADILIVLLKLQLKSLSTNGIIEIDGLCDSIEDEISVIIDEDINLIKLSLAALRRFDLISLVDTKDIKMLLHNELVGSETASTIRSRKSRELSKKEEKALLSNTNATNCNTDIEIDIEKEIDIEIDIDIEKEQTNQSINQFIKLVSEITETNIYQVQQVINLAALRDYDINLLIIKIKESDFLSGKLETKPIIRNFTQKTMLDKIIVDFYKNKKTNVKDTVYNNKQDPNFEKELDKILEGVR